MSASPRRLWHYTAWGHLPDIWAAGRLTTTESNIGAPKRFDPVTNRWAYGEPFGRHVGPDVVFLFDRIDPRFYGDGGMMMNQQYRDPLVDKTMVRFEVLVDGARPWTEWCEEQGISKRWRKQLAKAGRETQWWILERDIPAAEWEKVEAKDPKTGEWGPVGIVNGIQLLDYPKRGTDDE